jgi:tetratricopeptide (TPR) repeat protein
LAQLVDNRLLRAEKRVGSVYYELSHDSLVAPIRLSQRTSMYLLLKEAEQLHSESQIGPAIAKYKKFLKANPQNKGAYETLAVLYLEIGEKEKAFDIYKKAISADVEFAGIYKKIRDVLKQKNDTETLEELYGIALQVKSKDAYHYFKLGFDYYYLKKYDAAIASFKKALELKPNYTSAYNNMGAAQVKKGDYDAAIVSYQKALELKPGYAVAYNNMGIAYRKKGDYDAAIASYQKALEIEPTYRFAKENLSELYLTTERFDKAMELARKLLKEKDVQQGDILAMKSIIISSLFFKGNQARALMELQQFITYYRGLTKEYAREWTYSPTKKFISKTKRLSEPTRALLLKMLDLLETPLKEAEPILLELEKMVKELGK